ncbi:hypothetical protein N1851_000308 [Merluccius polli]|uniref:Uncharacterized protein n=1 Tax=Merluccius polli TaxID=89951 RepID=A0AA47NE52_MERPO|nr:hypothetical protein N1851_000308 [Merluccius polli]
MKRRFHVLHGEIRLSPERASTVITVCANLHNRHFVQLFLGDPEAFPGQPRDSLSSVSRVFPEVSYQLYVP